MNIKEMCAGKTVLLICAIIFLFPYSLLAKGNKEDIEPEIRVINDMQNLYSSFDETVPAIVMLPAQGSSIIPGEMLLKIDTELTRQMVTNKIAKPVLMTRWLTLTYGNGQKKAENPFDLFSAVSSEKYSVSLRGFCRPYIFKSQDFFILELEFYSLSITNYPVKIIRFFNNEQEIANVVSVCLNEFKTRFFSLSAAVEKGKKRVVIDPFTMDLRKIVELESGEFDFITTPFITLDGIPIRAGDDYFSKILGYQLASTQLFQVMNFSALSEYSETHGINSVNADYRIKGKVKLTDKINIILVDVYDLKNNSKIYSIQYPMDVMPLRDVWNIYQLISEKIVSTIFTAEQYSYVPQLEAPKYGFFINDMFAGWDIIKNFALPKGLHKIKTGSYLSIDSDYIPPPQTDSNGKKIAEFEKMDSTYFLLLENVPMIFTDRKGEYVWKLLEK